MEYERAQTHKYRKKDAKCNIDFQLIGPSHVTDILHVSKAQGC